MGYDVTLIDMTAEIDEKLTHKHTQTFQVTSDDKIGALTAAALVGIQPYYAYSNIYEFNTAARCLNISSSKASEDCKQWNITYTYGTPPAGTTTASPLDVPILYSQSWESSTITMDRDVFGKPIVNAAGDPYNPGVEKTRSILVVSATVNLAYNPSSLAMYFMDTLNMNSFWGVPKGKVLCRNISSSQEYDQQIGVYYKCNFELAFDLNGFNVFVMNRGLFEKKWNSALGKYQHIRIKDGNEVDITEPVPLTKTGAPLPIDADPIFYEYQVNYFADFSALPIA